MRSQHDPRNRLHQDVVEVHDDVSRLMGQMGNPKCIDAADLYAQLCESNCCSRFRVCYQLSAAVTM